MSTKEMKVQKRLKLALSFCESGASLRRHIEARRNPGCANQNITARRARQVSSSYEEADRLEILKQVFEGMAEDLTKDQFPRILQGVNTRGMIERLMIPRRIKAGLHKSHIRDLLNAYSFSRNPSFVSARKSIKRLISIDTHDCYLELTSLKQIDDMLVLCRNANGVYTGAAVPDLNTARRFLLAGIKTDEHWRLAHEAIMDYSRGPSPKRIKEKKLRELEYSLIGTKIPGFFPTPKPVAERLVQLADIKRGMSVLEPSAGKGDIAEVIRNKHPKIDLGVIEINQTLVKVLTAKGFKVHRGGDFLNDTGFYDRIIMNPPFENGQDIDHVRWAYSRLKPEGILVSIMCEAPFFRKGEKYDEFRDWFDSLNGTQDQLPSGAFQGVEAFRQTGVSSRIITIEKRG